MQAAKMFAASIFSTIHCFAQCKSSINCSVNCLHSLCVFMFAIILTEIKFCWLAQSKFIRDKIHSKIVTIWLIIITTSPLALYFCPVLFPRWDNCPHGVLIGQTWQQCTVQNCIALLWTKSQSNESEKSLLCHDFRSRCIVIQLRSSIFFARQKLMLTLFVIASIMSNIVVWPNGLVTVIQPHIIFFTAEIFLFFITCCRQCLV